METEVLWSAIGAICGLFALLISYLAYRERHSATIRSGSDERIKQIAKNELSDVILKHTELAAKLDAIQQTQTQILEDLHEQGRRVGTLLDRVTVLETKTEVFWRSVAVDMAKVIHSPDPRRKHIDDLLDAFMDGKLTATQETELRSILEVLRDYEPGVTHLTFPVYPGEQIAAAILLRTLDVGKVERTKGGKR